MANRTYLAALLRQGVQSMPGGFVTIELYEIAALIDEETFYRDLKDALDAPDDDWWNHSRLLGVSYLRPVPWEPTRITSA
jgi:hypothetical protein